MVLDRAWFLMSGGTCLVVVLDGLWFYVGGGSTWGRSCWGGGSRGVVVLGGWWFSCVAVLFGWWCCIFSINVYNGDSRIFS